jgi:hypothetical protein
MYDKHKDCTETNIKHFHPKVSFAFLEAIVANQYVRHTCIIKILSDNFSAMY